jgi:hypothetical protein
MNFITTITTTSVLALLLVSVAQGRGGQPLPLRLYVAPNGNDAWSGKLPAPNATKTDGPLLTVEGAQKAVRALLNGKPPTQPITVFLRGGTYRIVRPIVFTLQDSGTKDCPIIYAASPGEKPVIDGGRRITGFKQTGKLWTVTIPDVKAGKWSFSSLFVNGKRAQRARIPNEGFLRVAAYNPPGRDPRTAFFFKAGDIKPWQRLEDAVVVVYHSWETSLLHVKSLDTEKNVVEFTGAAAWHFGYWGPNQRYHVENVYEGLDSPGEWYLNRETGVLSYYPLPGQRIENTEIVAPVVTEFVRFAGEPEVGAFVEHVALKGITFQHADWTLEPQGHSDPQAVCTLPAAIMATGALACSLEGCAIAHVGKYAVWLRRGCKDWRLARNHLYDLGAGGVRIGETNMPKDETDEVGRNVVDNNYVHHYGEVYAAGVGVYIAQSSDNQITHNEIHDGYYSGMSIGWNWGSSPTRAHRNLIAHNHIHHVLRGLLSDGGGIYTLGTSPGTIIRNNVIHDVFSYEQPTIAWGVYLDAESNQILVENNLCYNVHNGGLMMHNGAFENVVRNNIFARCAHQLIWRAQPRGGPNVFERNVCYVTQGNLFLVDSNPDVKSTWDRNLYWRTDGEELLFNEETLDEWQERGLDRNSIVAGPEFVNPDSHDFRLTPTSPAITKLGFKPFDIRDCGLYGDAAWVNLPKQQKFPPTVLPLPPPSSALSSLAEDFEGLPVGGQPNNAGGSLGEIPGGSITITTAKAASGTKSLKIGDAPGLKNVWDPHLFYQTFINKGVVRLRFKLYVGPGAIPWMEWRDGNYPYQVGPSLRVDEKDQLVANGKVLTTLPREKWSEFEIVCALGKEASGTYDLRIVMPGQEVKHFPQLSCDPRFKRLGWLGFVSLATTKTEFFVDDVYLDAMR